MSGENNPVLIAYNIINIISKYYDPIISCLSILGNSLSLCVLFCTKLRYSSSSIYLSVLPTSDIVISVTFFLVSFTIGEYHFTHMYLLVLYWFLNFWVMAAFTFDRYRAIKWPLNRHFLCTVKRAKEMIITIAELAILYTITRFVFKNFNIMKNYNNYNTTLEMTYKDANNNDIQNVKIKDGSIIINHKYWIIIVIDTITFGLPIIMILMFNILILYNIKKDLTKLKKSAALTQQGFKSIDEYISHIKVTKMLVTISSIFICLETPGMVYLFCWDYKCDMSDTHVLISCISIWLATTRSGMNFVLYWATGENFRRELIHMFTKRSNSRQDEHLEKNDFVD